MERLVFSYGNRRPEGMASPRPVITAPVAARLDVQPVPPVRERRDWAFVGLLAFTAVLYFRPQDQLPGLSLVPFAEITALFGLGAMIMGRISKGLTLTRLNPELIAVAALGFVMLLTAPFSVWPGGAVGTFTDVFVKVILIYALMTNTLTTPARLHRFLWVMVVATGYIATRAVVDYGRGFNLVENGRVQGAVGGMFQNPNDLALNMVAVLPLAALVALRSRTPMARYSAWFLALMMIFAVMASQSRGGFVGLAVMVVVFAIQLARRQPRLLAGFAIVVLFAMPFAPSSYWERVSSITDDSLDATGSREARRVLLREAWQTYLTFPLHGVGAGQFQNYNPPGRMEIWRETHNVVLQVAAELGTLGLLIFGFLLWRGFSAGRTTAKLLRRASGPKPSRWQTAPRPAGAPLIDAAATEALQSHASTMTAAMAGWFVCALFASVAYSWTFYYLLALAVAPHQVLLDRLKGAASARKPAPAALEVRT